MIGLAVTRFGVQQLIWDQNVHQRVQLSFIDVKRAKIDRVAAPWFGGLPPQDPGRDKFSGELLRHIYGTRPAADGWEEV